MIPRVHYLDSFVDEMQDPSLRQLCEDARRNEVVEFCEGFPVLICEAYRSNQLNGTLQTSACWNASLVVQYVDASFGRYSPDLQNVYDFDLEVECAVRELECERSCPSQATSECTLIANEAVLLPLRLGSDLAEYVSFKCHCDDPVSRSHLYIPLLFSLMIVFVRLSKYPIY